MYTEVLFGWNENQWSGWGNWDLEYHEAAEEHNDGDGSRLWVFFDESSELSGSKDSLSWSEAGFSWEDH